MMQNEKTAQELINIRNACGSRVVLDGKSCVAPIDDRAFFDKCFMYSESKSLHAKILSHGGLCLMSGRNVAEVNFSGFRILSLRRKKCFRKLMNVFSSSGQSCLILPAMRSACRCTKKTWRTFWSMVSSGLDTMPKR